MGLLTNHNRKLKTTDGECIFNLTEFGQRAETK